MHLEPCRVPKFCMLFFESLMKCSLARYKFHKAHARDTTRCKSVLSGRGVFSASNYRHSTRSLHLLSHCCNGEDYHCKSIFNSMDWRKKNFFVNNTRLEAEALEKHLEKNYDRLILKRMKTDNYERDGAVYRNEIEGQTRASRIIIFMVWHNVILKMLSIHLTGNMCVPHIGCGLQPLSVGAEQEQSLKLSVVELAAKSQETTVPVPKQAIRTGDKTLDITGVILSSNRTQRSGRKNVIGEAASSICN